MEVHEEVEEKLDFIPEDQMSASLEPFADPAAVGPHSRSVQGGRCMVSSPKTKMTAALEPFVAPAAVASHSFCSGYEVMCRV